MKITKLCKYMRARAAFEGVKWAMPKKQMQTYFDLGTRLFFGVEVAENGDLLTDSEQPEFFWRYMAN